MGLEPSYNQYSNSMNVIISIYRAHNFKPKSYNSALGLGPILKPKNTIKFQ